MIEYNSNHKKLNTSKLLSNIKKVIIAGAVVMIVTVFSGCNNSNYIDNNIDLPENSITQMVDETRPISETVPDIGMDEIIEFKDSTVYETCSYELGKTEITRRDMLEIKSLLISSEVPNLSLIDLQYCENLEDLFLFHKSEGAGAIDLNEISELPNLRMVTITLSKVCNTRSLSKIKNLETIQVVNCELLDFNGFGECDNLELLEILDTNVEDLSFVSKLPNLNELTIKNILARDFSPITSLSKLEILDIERCDNIATFNGIEKLKNLKSFSIDSDVATWMTKEMYNYLANSNFCDSLKDEYLEEINQLDSIIKKIIPDMNMKDEDKLKAIVLYVLDNLEFDEIVRNDENTEEGKALNVEYNAKPLYYALKGKGVCINYATLTNALFNRAGLSSYYITSDSHAWNLVECEGNYYYVDTTWCDNVNRALNSTEFVNDKYYSFTPNDVLGDDTHEADFIPSTIEFRKITEETTEAISDKSDKDINDIDYQVIIDGKFKYIVSGAVVLGIAAGIGAGVAITKKKKGQDINNYDNDDFSWGDSKPRSR